MTHPIPPGGQQSGPPPAYYAPAGPTYPPGTGSPFFAGQAPPPGSPQLPPGPPPPKSRVLIVGIVAGAIVLLAAIGAMVMIFHQPAPQPTVITPSPSQPVPSSPTTPTTPPGSQPTTQPNQPSTGPTAAPPPTEQPNPNRVVLAEGIGVVPAPLYELQDKGPGYASFSNGNDIFIARVIKLPPNTDPGRRCVDELASVNRGASALKIPPPQPVNGNPSLKIATCQSSAIYSDGGGSRIAYAGAVVSVRPSDGVTVIGTVVFNTSSVPSQLNQDVSAMVNSMLRDQARR